MKKKEIEIGCATCRYFIPPWEVPSDWCEKDKCKGIRDNFSKWKHLHWDIIYNKYFRNKADNKNKGV